MVFVKDGDVVIVKGGFDFEERVDVFVVLLVLGSYGGNSGVRVGLLRVLIMWFLYV